MSYSGLRYITSIITYVTRYLDTTITEIREVKTAINTTYVTSTDVAPWSPGIPVDKGGSGHPETVVSELNGTVVTIAGTTVPVTCAATKAFNIFPGINNHVGEYFETHEGPTRPPVPGPTSTFNPTVVSFSTPFVYLPIRFATAAHIIVDIKLAGPSDRNKRALAPATTFGDINDGAPEDYGYIPQALIDWAVQDDKYPGLASCLPGGPRIEQNETCKRVEPAFQEAVPDLTLSSAVTVDDDGCFDPVGCPNAKLSSLRSGNLAAPSVSAARTTVESADLAEPTASILSRKSSQTDISRSSTADAIVAAPGEKPNPDVASRTTNSAVEVQTQSQPQASSHHQASGKESSTVGSQTEIPRSSTADAIVAAPVEKLNPDIASRSTNSAVEVQKQTSGKGSSNVGANTNSRFADDVVSSSPSPSSPLALPPNQQVEVQAGSQTLTPIVQSSSTYYALDSATLTPGGPSLTISGNNYYVPVSATALVVNDAATPIQNPGYSPSDIASLIMGAFGPSNAPAVPPMNVVVGKPSVVDDWDRPEFEGTTDVQGRLPTTLNDATYSPAVPTVVVIDGVISPLTPDSPSSRAADNLKISSLVASLDLTPGAPAITVSGTTYSLPPSPTAISIKGSPSNTAVNTQRRPTPGGLIPTPDSSPLTMSGKMSSAPTSQNTLNVDNSRSFLPPMTSIGLVNSAVVIAGSTLTPGAPTMTVSGTAYSLPATLRGVFVNGVLSPLPEATAGPQLILGDLTLTPGAAPTTISDTAYYLSSTPSPTAILVNGSPSPLPFQHTTAAQPGFVLGTQSLRVGSAITVSGVVISLPTGEIGEIVVGGTTKELPQLTESGKEVPLTVGAGVVTATLGFLTSSVSANNGEKGNQSAATGVGGERIINSSGVRNGGNGTGAYTGPEFVGTASRSLGSWDSLQRKILAGIVGLSMFM
ncbi:MAG: hypothetical protein Q9178_004442 [Gyalolechia marmorata]